MSTAPPPAHAAEAPKSPDKVRAGRAGARARWSGHTARTVTLESLTAEQRRLVLALIAAARQEGEAAEATASARPAVRS